MEEEGRTVARKEGEKGERKASIAWMLLYAGEEGRGRRDARPGHLEAQFRFRAAEIDFIDAIAIGVLGGLHARVVELLVTGVDFYGRGEGLGAIEVGKDRVGSVDLQLILSGLELHAADLRRIRQD